MLKTKKFKSVKEFRQEIAFIKNGIKESIIDPNDNSNMKRAISERNRSRKNKTFINNNIKENNENKTDNELDNLLNEVYKNQKTNF